MSEKIITRAAITNHRSKNEDFEILINEVVRPGDELLKEKYLR